MENSSAQIQEVIEKTAKAFGDLDELIKALLASLPRLRPWQRQLHQYLGDIERHMQVTRMTVAMERSDQEIAEAVKRLQTALKVAQRYLATGRADLGTKAAVGFACELGQQVAGALAPQHSETGGLVSKHASGDEGVEQGSDLPGHYTHVFLRRSNPSR